MSQSKDVVIKELIMIICDQVDELNKLKRKLDRIQQYIDVYETYIKGDSKWLQK